MKQNDAFKVDLCNIRHRLKLATTTSVEIESNSEMSMTK